MSIAGNGLRSIDSAVFLKALFGPQGGGGHTRPQKVVEWALSLENDCGVDFWAVVTTAWSSFDLIPHRDFEMLFRKFKHFAPAPVSLSAPLTVFRGQNALVASGLSWTTNLEVAEGFARGHRGVSYPEPTILEMEIGGKDIAFALSDRGEDEIVLWRIPPKSRSIRSRSVTPWSTRIVST